MATTSFQSLHRPLLQHHHHHHLPPTDPSSSLFLKPPTTSSSLSLKHTSASSSLAVSSNSLTTPSNSVAGPSPALSFDLLEQHLSSQDLRQADEETRRLVIVLAGEAALKRGYVFFSEVKFISELDLKAIDGLWRQYSNNRFGYSVQKRIWEKSRRDFTKFFMKVGWMKKLDTEVEQFNYRAFPEEFIWEMDDKTPEGHLPLTNALRGTQLLNSIFTHPAFQGEEEEEFVMEEKEPGKSQEAMRQSTKPMTNRTLKTDYSF